MQMFLQQLVALFLPTKDKVGLFAATLWKVLSEALFGTRQWLLILIFLLFLPWFLNLSVNALTYFLYAIIVFRALS